MSALAFVVVVSALALLIRRERVGRWSTNLLAWLVPGSLLLGVQMLVTGDYSIENFFLYASGALMLVIVVSLGHPARLLPDEVLPQPDEEELRFRQKVRDRARTLMIWLVVPGVVIFLVYYWNTL